MLTFSPQTQNRHLFLLLPVVMLAAALLVTRTQPMRAGLALLVLIAGTELMGDANETRAGVIGWGYVGGGGLTILVAYLFVLAAGRRHLCSVEGERGA